MCIGLCGELCFFDAFENFGVAPFRVDVAEIVGPILVVGVMGETPFAVYKRGVGAICVVRSDG